MPEMMVGARPSTPSNATKAAKITSSAIEPGRRRWMNQEATHPSIFLKKSTKSSLDFYLLDGIMTTNE